MNNVTFMLSRRAYLLQMVVFGVAVAAALWLITGLLSAGMVPLAVVLSAITVFLALIFTRRRFSPFRWLALGMALTMLFTMYPLFYTLYLSVTNMGSGHLMSQGQAIARLESELYLPEDGQTYSWAAFRAADGSYALWLTAEDGTGLLARPNAPLETVENVGEVDEDGVPLSLAGYERLPLNQTMPILADLGEITFGEPPNAVRISSLREAAELEPKYQYDAAQGVMVDMETGVVFRSVEGTFTSDDGAELQIGYIDVIGFRHYANFLGSEGFRQPLMIMLVWNIAFALGSVVFSFALGMVVTLLFEGLPGKRIIRALLIIPWPIPAVISILIWRSMLHPDLGFVAPILESLFGSSPEWFSNPWWTRFALILVNVWLSYPYFYVITAGAIRSIPSEIYDAAVVDGAGGFAKLRKITLPLVLRIMMPLLIASFTFNFNNFNLIYIFNYGNPPMPNTLVPMGYTDILISFVYRLAFIPSNIANYGLAAAITVLLFALISVMVLLQMRFTKMFKEAN